MKIPFIQTGKLRFFPALTLLFALLFGTFSAVADLVGPYTPDANTLFLLHFDEAAGGSVTTNLGTKGGNFYSVDETAASATPPVVTTQLGAPGYVNGATNFNLCMTNFNTGYEFGFDFNNSGAYQGDVSATAPSPDALVMTNLNMGNGGQTPFTLEAAIQPTTTAGNQEIICTDNSGPPNGSGNVNRGFQFRITSGSLQFSIRSPDRHQGGHVRHHSHHWRRCLCGRQLVSCRGHLRRLQSHALLDEVGSSEWCRARPGHAWRDDDWERRRRGFWSADHRQ